MRHKGNVRRYVFYLRDGIPGEAAAIDHIDSDIIRSGQTASDYLRDKFVSMCSNAPQSTKPVTAAPRGVDSLLQAAGEWQGKPTPKPNGK